MPARMDLPEKQIARLYVGGESENRIAQRYGVARAVIRRRLLENGIAPRSHSEAEFLKWSQMTTAQRAGQVAAAHDAVRGRPLSFEHLCARARGFQRELVHVSPIEIELLDMLEARGLDPVQQLAVGPYNCDLTIDPVAVEVWGGYFHWYGKHRAIVEKRFRYILNRGWNIYVIPVTRSDPLTEARADDLVAYINAVRRHPPVTPEYRVVWSAGEWERVGTVDDDKIAVEAPFRGTRNPTTGQYERIAR